MIQNRQGFARNRGKTSGTKSVVVAVVGLLALVLLVYGASSNLGAKLREFIFGRFGKAQDQQNVDIGSPSVSSQPPDRLPASSAIIASSGEESQSLQTARSRLSLTYKSCLGKYCMDGDFKDSAGQAVTRVGLLAPDEQWFALTDLLRGLRHIADSKDNIEFVPSTHVPPYGYGRNHGYSRIIRIAEDVAAQASTLIRPIVTEANKQPLYEMQIRQLVRWHCRLNHVAAHSAMLTVFVDDLRRRPFFEIQRIASFAGLKIREEDIQAVLAKLPALQQALSSASSAQVPGELAEAAARSIASELDNSRNLSVWPCKSFKELETSFSSALLSHRRYYMLSPNCSAPFTKCSVQYDFREQIA
eukprot:gene31451-38016_t